MIICEAHMKTSNGLKIFRIMFVAALALLTPLFATATGCGGGATTSPPVYLPAPTGGYINTTAPDENGNILVFGLVYANSVPVPYAEVSVTNKNTTTVATATADDAAYFSLTIAGSIGDILSIIYTDPESGYTSEATELTVGNSLQAMSSGSMSPYGVAADTASDQSIAVANDGTNSEIIKIDIATGAIDTRAAFSNKKYDRIAVHSGLGFAAVLDTTSGELAWYDLSNLSSDMAATSTADISATPHDVAVADLDATPYTTDDFVVVTHDRNNLYGVVSIFPIVAGSPPTLGAPSTNNCIGDPDDATYYPNCSALSAYTPTKAGIADIVRNSNNFAYLAFVEYYDTGTGELPVVHFAHFTQGGIGVGFSFDLTPGNYFSTDLGASVVPYAIRWYTDTVALLTDPTLGVLYRLEESTGTSIASQPLTVGSSPLGVAADSANNRAFVADQAQSSIVGVDMTDFQLSGTTYPALFHPTDITYDENKLGVVLTIPLPLFKVIDVTQ